MHFVFLFACEHVFVSLPVHVTFVFVHIVYDSIATVGEIRVYRRADFQSGSRVLKKVF